MVLTFAVLTLLSALVWGPAQAAEPTSPDALNLVPSLEEALQRARADKAPEREARALNALGDALLVRDALSDAEACHQEALQLATRLNDGQEQAAARIGLGRVALLRGALPEAEAHQREAQALATQHKLPLFEALATLELGRVWAQQGRVEEAQAAFAQAMETLDALGDASGQAEVMLAQAALAVTLNTDAKVTDLYQQALTLKTQVGDPYGQMRALIGLGTALAGGRSNPEATQRLEEGRRLAVALGSRAGEASALIGLAKIQATTQGRDHAERTLKEAFEIYLALGMPSGQAWALLCLSTQQSLRGKRDEALQTKKRALEIAERHGLKILATQALLGIYGHYSFDASISMYSRPAEAETASRLLIQLAIQHGEPGWEAEAQYDLGRALALQGHLSEAEACFRRSIALYTGPAQDGYEEARVQHTLAELLLAQGRLTEAEPTLRRAIEGLAAARDWQAETLALFKLTALLFDLGRPDEAVQTLRRSYPLTRLTGDPQPAEAKILVRVARGLMDTKMLRDAEWALRRCLTRATAVRNLECYLEALSMLTGLLSETGRTDEAEQVYRDALALAAELNSAHLELMVHVEMAEWSASYGRSDDARAVLRRCVDNARSTSRGDLEALCLLTRSATTSSPRAALLFSRRAYALAKLAERDRLMAEALVSVARARERLGHPRRAERALRRAIPLAEAAEAAEVEAEALTLLAGILEARGETEEAAALRE